MARGLRFVACIALLAVFAAAAAPVARAADSPPDHLQAQFRSLTGLRGNEPTLVAGAILNGTGGSLPAVVELSDVPAGVALAEVRPSREQPEDGTAWTCDDLTCTLTDAAGRPTPIVAGSGAEILLVLSTPADLGSDAAITVAVRGAPSQKVALAVASGATPAIQGPLVVRLAGDSELTPGVLSTVTAQVTNASATPLDGDSLAVNVELPAIDGVVVGARGDGWSCVELSCTYPGTLAPYAVAPLLELDVLAPAEAPAVPASPLAAHATATIAGAPVEARGSLDQEVVPPTATGVSARLALDDTSVAVPASIEATLSVTPTGIGELAKPVVVKLTVPEHVRVAWDRAVGDGWECREADAQCRSIAPLQYRTPSEIRIPLEVGLDVEPGSYEVKLVAEVVDEPEERSTTTAAFVVVPPPVAELRASLAPAGTALDGETDAEAALVFAAAEPRAFQVVVQNVGSRPAYAGTPIVVTLTPDGHQSLDTAGDDRWTCTPGRSDSLDEKTPLTCTTRLEAELAVDATATVPIRLGPSAPGRSTWTVQADIEGTKSPDAGTTAFMVVEPAGPMLVPHVASSRRLLAGATGELTVQVTNRGTSTAVGGVVVVAIPPGLEVVGIAADNWHCLDVTVGARGGTLTCSTSDEIPADTIAVPFVVEVATSRTGTSPVTAWASAPNQYHGDAVQASSTYDLHVTDTASVHAGPTRTVVTPQRGPDGQMHPAIVVLNGSADPTSAESLTWVQRCTVVGERGCDHVAPAVEWLDVAPGSTPTTRVARFVAPTITGPVTLRFELRAQHGSRTAFDDTAVHLVPATLDGDRPVGRAPAAPPPTAGSTAGSTPGTTAGSTPGSTAGSTTTGLTTAVVTTAPTSTSAAAGEATSTSTTQASPPTTMTVPPPPTTAPTPTTTTPPPTVAIDTAGDRQVPTRGTGRIVGSATGSGDLTFEWKQTDGPSAAVNAGSSSEPTLVFTAPDLKPDQSSTELTFELTVTDGQGRRASAGATVEVVWGDDGLAVELAGGASNVLAAVDGPVVVTATVDSAGAPYTYDWSVVGLSVPGGTATDAPTLTFDAGDRPTTGSVTVKVTDSFGRTATRSVPVTVSALAADEPPAGFCDAIEALAADEPATIAGPGVEVQIPTASVTGASESCVATATARFTDATVSLPGGITVTRARGQLSLAGVSIDEGAVTGPDNWGVGSLAIPSGLLAPFTGDGLGVPYGAIVSERLPLMATPAGWTAHTTVTYDAPRGTTARIAASATSSSPGGAIQLEGTASGDGATRLDLRAAGLVGIGSIDVVLSGPISTGGPRTGVASSVRGSIDRPTPLDTDVVVRDAAVDWTPTGAHGSITLAVGAGPEPLLLVAAATFAGADVTLTFDPHANDWVPAPGAPQLRFSGSGSIRGGNLALNLTGSATEPWVLGSGLALDGVTATLSTSCSLTEHHCDPWLGVTARATSTALAEPVEVRGNLDVVTRGVSLTGTLPELTVAPVSVRDVALTIGFTSRTAPTVTAAGTAGVLGADHPATIAFGSDATIVAIDAGPHAMVADWTIPAATLLATDAPATYTPPADVGPSGTSVLLTPGTLTGVGVAELPPALRPEGMPAWASTALATFDLTDGSVADYHLEVVPGDPWFVAGAADAAMALEVTTIGYVISRHDDGDATVAASGQGALITKAVVSGATTTPVPLTFSGSLASSSNGGALSLTFVAADPMADAFGVAGLGFDDLSIRADVGPHPTATLAGVATLPAAFGAPYGIPETARPNVTADLAAVPACAVINLGSGGALGVDIASAGFVTADTAALVIAPESCLVKTVTVEPGLTLLLAGGLLGTVALELDPTSFDVADEVVAPSLPIGGVVLTDATVAIRVAGGVPSIDVRGSTHIDGQALEMRGAVQAPTDAATSGTITLTATAPALKLDWSELTGVTVTATSASRVNASISTVTLRGSLAALGTTIPVELQGLVAAGTIDDLSQELASTKYQLPKGDSLETALAVEYDTATKPALTIAGDGGTLRTPTRTFDSARIVATGSGFTLVRARTAFASTLTQFQGAWVEGTYTSTGPGAGTYAFGSGRVPVASLDGFEAPSTVTFARQDGVESGNQESELYLGLFDEKVPVTVRGPIDAKSQATLTGTVKDVTFRGLAGDATVTFAPVTTDSGSVVYMSSIQYATKPGACPLWSGTPVLTGRAYRGTENTYYTLTGTATLALPGGLSLGAIPGQSNQPMVLSNEKDHGQPQAATGLTLALGVQSTAFSATGQLSFDLVKCAWSIGGSLQLRLGGSALGNGFNSAFKAAPPIQANFGNLFGGSGAMPANIASFRGWQQGKAHGAQIQAQKNRNQSEAQFYGHGATQAKDDHAAAQGRLNNLEARRNEAQANYDRAWQNLQQSENKVAALDAVRNSSARLDAAITEVNVAQRNVDQADAKVQAADRKVADARARVTATETASRKADEAAAAAKKKADEYEAAAKRAKDDGVPLSISFSYTRCLTCKVQNNFSISGEIELAIYTIGLDLSVGFSSKGVASIEGQLSGGIGKSFKAAAGPLGAYAGATLKLAIGLGYDFTGKGLYRLDIALIPRARVSVFLDLWCCTLSATLADVSGDLRLAILPSTQLSGYLSFYVFGFEARPGFGPIAL